MKGGTGSQGGTVKVQVQGECGLNFTDDIGFSFGPCGSAYRLYPNPSSDELTIARTSPTTAASPADGPDASPAAPADDPGSLTLVRLYDSYGQLRLEQATAPASTLRLRVATLPAGLYVVELLHGQQQLGRQQLQVQR